MEDAFLYCARLRPWTCSSTQTAQKPPDQHTLWHNMARITVQIVTSQTHTLVYALTLSNLHYFHII